MAAHITAMNAEEITLKSLLCTAQQLSTVNNSLKNFCDSIAPVTWECLFYGLDKDLRTGRRFYGLVKNAD